MAYRIVNKYGTLQWEEYEEKPIPERAVSSGNCQKCGEYDKLAAVSNIEFENDKKARAVRHSSGSVKRVVTALGSSATAISNVHQYLSKI